MKIMYDNFNDKLNEKTYIALGSFDGLHIGHMALISKTVELANKSNAKSMVYTFKNHPLSVINKDLMPSLIMSNEEKINTLNKLNVDIVNMAEFNESYMKIFPEDYIKKMTQFYNVRGFVVGFNYRFGYKNLGDVNLLTKLSKKFNFELYSLNPVTLNGEIVSSSRIRKLILNGEIESANAMLSRPFSIYGSIIKGKQIGHITQFPTANLKYSKEYIIPKCGAYFTIVEFENKHYRGLTNIGYNPTISDYNDLSVETHILDFNKNIYGEKIKINFINRIRDEQKFNSINELTEQLKIDKQYVQNQTL